jgi:hypothetical protein
MQKSSKEGIALSEAEATKWIEAVNRLFPGITEATRQFGGEVRSSNKFKTLAGTQLPLAGSQQNTSIWNELTRTSSNELARA